MDFFLDTNVIIEYIFSIDFWHENALKVFRIKKTFYWSETVKNETTVQTQKYLWEIKNILKEIKDNINIKSFTKKSFITFVESLFFPPVDGKVNKINRKKFAEYIWKKGKFKQKVQSKDLIKHISKLSKNINYIIFARFLKCKNKIILHSRRKEYKNLLNKFNSLRIPNVKDHIHSPDNNILLDAHDLACKGIDINFITADCKLLNFKEEIIKLTEIKEMTNLNSL